MCILVIPPPCWHLVCFTCSHFCHFDLPSSTLSLSFWCTLNTVIITIFKFLTANSKSDTSGMVSTDWFIFFLMGCIFMSLCISTWVLNIMHFTFSVQSLSHGRLSATPRTAVRQASLSITNSQRLLKLMSIESVMPSNRLILFCSLLLPSIIPSIRVFSNESVLHIK